MSSGRISGRPGWDVRAEATTSPDISAPQHVPLEDDPPGHEDVAWWDECYPEESSWVLGAEQATATAPRLLPAVCFPPTCAARGASGITLGPGIIRLLASLPAERRATILRENERRHNARRTTTVPSGVGPLPQPHADLEGAGRAQSPEWADITILGR